MLSSIYGEEDAGSLSKRVYGSVCRSLMSGEFRPGQKITTRTLAAAMDMSLTPVREALQRLVAENILDGEAGRSIRVPTMTGAQLRELRDVRILNEVYATKMAARSIAKDEVEALRRVAETLDAARQRGDVRLDVQNIYTFQFKLYSCSGMPLLVHLIETFWLRSGPYLTLLFPHYVDELRRSRGQWRFRLCDALDRGDEEAAGEEIRRDIHDAMSYMASVSEAAHTFV